MGSANQAVIPGRTTLLDAVNVCLSNVGEQAVNTLDDPQLAEVSMAERIVLEYHKEGQTRGWAWNSEEAATFAKDLASGTITVPANVISWSADRYQWAGRYQLRGQVVYDSELRTTLLTDVTSLDADVVVLLPWDQSPEPFNRWITIRSARVFAARLLTSDSLNSYTKQDEYDALVQLERLESAAQKPNILTDGPGLTPFRSYSPAFGSLGRRGAPFRG